MRIEEATDMDDVEVGPEAWHELVGEAIAQARGVEPDPGHTVEARDGWRRLRMPELIESWRLRPDQDYVLTEDGLLFTGDGGLIGKLDPHPTSTDGETS